MITVCHGSPARLKTHAGDGDVEGWRSSEDRSRLGHASINITLDLYSHVVEGMQEKATERVDETLRIALQKYRPKPVG